MEKYVTTRRGKIRIPLWSRQHKLLLARRLPHSVVTVRDGKKTIERVFSGRKRRNPGNVRIIKKRRDTDREGNRIKQRYWIDPSKKKKVWCKWKKLVNMERDELKKFIDSDEGVSAGLSREKAMELGIKSGRESARWLLKMIPKGKTFDHANENWTPKMWEWAQRQNSFNSRMIGVKGPLYDDGKKTRKHLALLIWGHNPEKKSEKKFGMPVCVGR